MKIKQFLLSILTITLLSLSVNAQDSGKIYTNKDVDESVIEKIKDKAELKVFIAELVDFQIKNNVRVMSVLEWKPINKIIEKLEQELKQEVNQDNQALIRSKIEAVKSKYILIDDYIDIHYKK